MKESENVENIIISIWETISGIHYCSNLCCQYDFMSSLRMLMIVYCDIVKPKQKNFLEPTWSFMIVYMQAKENTNVLSHDTKT